MERPYRGNRRARRPQPPAKPSTVTKTSSNEKATSRSPPWAPAPRPVSRARSTAVAPCPDLRRQHLREAPDVGVVAVHGVVVILARHRDAVLGPLELILERPEILVRLELRVVLGDRE